MIKLSSIMTLVFMASVAHAGINIDYCRFKAEDGDAYLEIYLEIPRLEVLHVADSAGWYGSVRFAVDISSERELLATDNWRIGDRITDISSTDSLQKIVDLRTYKLSPGIYDITLTAIDSLSRRTWNESFAIDISDFLENRLTVSDIEIANYLLPAGLIEKYDRSNFALIPAPNLVFGAQKPYFYYYLEIYPPADISSKYEFTIQRMILSNIGGKQFAVESLPELTFEQEQASFADVDSVSLAGLQSGSYTFAIQVVSSRGDTATQSKRFWIMRPDLIAAGIEQVDDEIRVDSAEVEQEFKEIQILIDNDENRRAETMSVRDKALFLNAFWRRYDDDKSTPEIPFREEFRSRVTEADRRWQNYRKPGYKTDMGRIFVLHGEPDYKEIHPLDANAKPYEVWTYDHLEGGGVQFVFVDRSGHGDYVLVHSEKRGEISQPDWYNTHVKQGGVDQKN